MSGPSDDNTGVVPTTLECRLEAIDAARKMVADLEIRGVMSPHERHVLELIIEELVTNTLKHGGCGPNSTIELRITFSGDALGLHYQDHGRPFDPLRDLPPDSRDRHIDERQLGGLGWPLIFHYANDVSYSRESSVNRISIRVPRFAA